jgi:hypothetical protein
MGKFYWRFSIWCNVKRGYLKLYRKIQDNWMWQDKPFSFGHAWIDLLISANIKDTKFVKRSQVIEVKRGQIAISTKGFADRWGWSRGKVDRFLKQLENEHQIEHQKSSLTTLITIVNYDDYNGTDTKTDIKRTSNGHRTDTSKEVKEGKEVKHKHGEFKNVLLTDREKQKLKDKFNGSFAEKIKDMDEAIEMKGYKYKSHYLAILKWERDKPKDKDIYSAEIYK